MLDKIRARIRSLFNISSTERDDAERVLEEQRRRLERIDIAIDVTRARNRRDGDR